MFTRAQFTTIYNHKFRKIRLLKNTDNYKKHTYAMKHRMIKCMITTDLRTIIIRFFVLRFVWLNSLKTENLSSSDSAATNKNDYICTLNSQVKNMLFFSISPVTNIQNGSSYEIRMGRPTDIHTKLETIRFWPRHQNWVRDSFFSEELHWSQNVASIT